MISHNLAGSCVAKICLSMLSYEYIFFNPLQLLSKFCMQKQPTNLSETRCGLLKAVKDNYDVGTPSKLQAILSRHHKDKRLQNWQPF